MTLLSDAQPPLSWFTIEYNVRTRKRVPAHTLEEAGRLAKALADGSIDHSVTILSVKSIECLLREQDKST